MKIWSQTGISPSGCGGLAALRLGSLRFEWRGGDVRQGNTIIQGRSADPQRVDFSSTPLHAIFVIHDNGMDWGLATQVITELLSSQGGILGTRRERPHGGTSGQDIPLVLTNPDVIWGS